MGAPRRRVPLSNGWRGPASSWAGLFLLALAAGFALDRGQFFRSYLFGFLFWVGIGVGSLGLAMLNHLTGGLWGLVPRRFHEAAARTLPAMALLFVPVLLGASSLYTWAQPEVLAGDEVLQREGGLPERAVLRRPRRLLLRGLGGCSPGG